MIRITKQTDYGIVLLTRMASEPERRWKAPDLAAETQLPSPMVSKILKILTRDGLLVSHRGVKGGYFLADHPERISVESIISSLEGPIAITECVDLVSSECEHEEVCPTRSNWHLINRAVRLALEGITLAEMTSPLAPRRLVTLGSGQSAAADLQVG